MKPRVLVALTLCLSLSAWARPVRADDTSEQRQERARALWEEAAAKYDVGRYDDAINLFNAAWDVWPFPPILFGLGQAYRQKKNYERAAFYYRAYLRRDPNAPNRSDVADLIEQMDAMVEQQRRSGEKPPTGAKPGGGLLPGGGDRDGQPRRWYADKWGWTVAGLGTIALGIGVGYLITAEQTRGEIPDAPTAFDRDQLREKADAQQAIGVPVAIGGAAVLAVGVGLLIWNPGSMSPRPTMAVGRGLAWIGVEGSF